MIFTYDAIDPKGNKQKGTIDAVNRDVAINSIQKRGLIITDIISERDRKEKSGLFREISFLNRITNREIVILSRQIATLFEAQVPALQVFRLLSAEVDNPELGRVLEEVTEDIQSGNTISKSIEKHPDVFSTFYVNMVMAGEESGRLDQSFNYMADYLDRSYEVTSKARNALMYPAFVVLTFIIVMGLMFTVVIPKITETIVASGQDVPIYTKIVIGTSQFFVNYWFIMLGLLGVVAVVFWRYNQTDIGKRTIDELKFAVPYVGDLYRKLYLSRIADNLQTMLSSGISMVRALEITADVVDSPLYKEILLDSLELVKGGKTLSTAFSGYDEIPGIMTQMARIGEETGSLDKILKMLSLFYQREVKNAVDTIVGLIEPVMVIALGVGVAILLAAVIMPIFQVASI